MTTSAQDIVMGAMQALEEVLVPLGGALQESSVQLLARPELALVLAFFWLLLRRRRSRVDIASEGEAILQARFKRGEISRETYERIVNRTHEAGK